jgi:nucleotide-binding universal stress UspA family protein
VAVRAPEAYRRILVPVSAALSPDEAMAIACRLSSDRGATVTILGVVEVPAELPLDAQMAAEDDAARQALAEARGVAELYGVAASTSVVRARSAAEAIVAQAKDCRAQLIVLGAPRRRAKQRVPIFGRTVSAVLGQAPCRVMVAAR